MKFASNNIGSQSWVMLARVKAHREKLKARALEDAKQLKLKKFNTIDTWRPPGSAADSQHEEAIRSELGWLELYLQSKQPAALYDASPRSSVMQES